MSDFQRYDWNQSYYNSKRYTIIKFIQTMKLVNGEAYFPTLNIKRYLNVF